QAEASKPARRYRFDRREPAARSVVSSKPVSLAPSPTEPAGVRPRQENTTSEQSPQSSKPTNGSPAEAPAAKPELELVVTSESEVAVPTAPVLRSHNDRRRRHGQEGQHAKTQVPIETIKDAVQAEPVRQADATRQADAINRVPTGTPAADQPVTETPPDAIPLEDLPPLEYSELQAASRRRRRHRPGSTAAASGSAPASKPVTQASASALSPVGPAPIAPVSPVTPTRTPNVPQTSYAIQSGMTVNQMNLGNEATGPFQGPEPTPARGSVLPVQPRLTRTMRNGNEAQRGSVMPLPSVRSGGDGILSTGAVNHLANVISQAIQTQSDRLVAELRRGNQAPANVSVTLPPFPSTERVGVFVDVANLLYSARTLRTTIDFGKLLDFLRGNRRLVRAHAYCPTSPQPGDDQMFLQAVKGLGYRITTKNYKTFASGAKKADMDLDLCMDVVRLVDGKAVDCIVLVSGDGDFIPLLDYCSDHGVRVEVVAFDESMSASLRQSCDLFINLSMLEEIRVS
ncbi:MAG TPA: NYN domain-containing protein, partial [Ktedonobacteraceae bacterium]